jgi:hypothetical protein
MNTTTTVLLASITFLGLVGPVAAQGNNELLTYIASLPVESVTPTECVLLQHMREEEKLARDVYQALDQQWHLPVFANIARSEQSHMDLVLLMLNRYQVADPLPSEQPGVFADPNMTLLYQVGVTFGSLSPLHALLVGAVIEDLDMFDLGVAVSCTDNRDIGTVWQNLDRGSRNHMRSFHAQLALLGLVYPGLFLPPAAITAIVTTPYENVPVDENGVPLF